MKLSVVIVSYNVKMYLEQCLMSLQRALQGIEAEVIVVDNHSRDGSVDYLSQRFPDATFVSSNHNLGFARANNIAIKQSTGQYVLLLNPDTVVAEDTLHRTLGFMDGHPQAGGLGVRMLKDDGSDAMESRRGLPSPMVAFYKMCGLCSHYPKSRRFGHYYMSYLPWDKPVQIEVISGAFCLLRREALDKVGLLDEDFFMYGEDIDLSYRLLKGGYENWYYPSRILHYKGESTQKTSFRYVHVFYGAMLIFFRKHYGHLSVLLSLPVKFAIYAKALVALARMSMSQIHKSLGFFSVEHTRQPLYVFVGTTASMRQCSTIARRNGLEAMFVEGDAQSKPDGHAHMQLPKARATYVVYDSNAYTFGQIMQIFSAGTTPGVHIGVYNPSNKTVITADEILK